MIIDFHTHTFPDKIAARTLEGLSEKSESHYYTDGTEKGLLEEMQKSGVDISVKLAVATKAEQVEKINTGIVDQINAGEVPAGLIYFGAMHPGFENPGQELKRLSEAGVKGIKIHPAYQNTDFDDIRFLRIMDKAEELGLIVITHSGWDIGIPERNFTTTKSVLKVLKEVSPTRLVLAHMGGWADWGGVKEYICGAPVYFDTAFSLGDIGWKDSGKTHYATERNLDTQEFTDLVNAHGVGRILFGTDSPWAPAGEYITFIKKAPGLSDAEKNMIFSDNAKALLGL